jgi:hypothetical protein
VSQRNDAPVVAARFITTFHVACATAAVAISAMTRGDT